jgi:hypothetical protein
MSVKGRVEAALAAKRSKQAAPKKAPAVKVVPAPLSGGGSSPAKENPLLGISRDLVSRMAEGKEALLALKAVRDWKSSEAIRRAHGSLAAYHDVLTELHAAGTIKFRGEDFMNTGQKKDGAELGLELHAKWVAAGKPGKFSDFIRAAKEAEAGRDRAKTEGAR